MIHVYWSGQVPTEPPAGCLDGPLDNILETNLVVKFDPAYFWGKCDATDPLAGSTQAAESRLFIHGYSKVHLIAGRRSSALDVVDRPPFEQHAVCLLLQANPLALQCPFTTGTWHTDSGCQVSSPVGHRMLPAIRYHWQSHGPTVPTPPNDSFNLASHPTEPLDKETHCPPEQAPRTFCSATTH